MGKAGKVVLWCCCEGRGGCCDPGIYTGIVMEEFFGSSGWSFVF